MNRKTWLDRRSIVKSGLALLGFGATMGWTNLGKAAQAKTKPTNQEAVEAYFRALETGQFEVLREIFAQDARQVMPYAFGDFPKSFDGREGIYKQYSSLPKLFSKMSFPRTIYPTENPNVLFVQFRGDIEIRAGGRYQNDYV
ncbi:nuclear transport factor 2 family protein, partial [Pseudanabaenaceae cyanobacterium LEGE 13415]|nr:nuclear transport factor 2 family protein [Pseudanabaenaceae cyanobacterium LEGE 13415]